MSNLIKYKKAFAESLSLKDGLINDKLEYESVPEWGFNWSYVINVVIRTDF